MKVLILGLSLIASCFASTGDSAPDGSAFPELPPAPLVLPADIPLRLPWLLSVTNPGVREILDTGALIRAAARKHGVPAAFIKSIVAAESNFDAAAISPKGAIGLMQLMPSTAQLFGADPTIPEQNVDAGTHYLRVLMDRYHKYRGWMKRVIAAYNAGPGAVDRYRGVPPYRETRTYVARVLGFLKQFQRERA